MAITNYARLLANDAYLDAIQAATTAAIKVYDADDNLLHTYTVNKAACTQDGTTGILTIVEGTTANSTGTGTGAYAQFTIDANILDDNIAVVQGSAAVANTLVVSSTAYVTGVGSQIFSFQFA